MDSNTVFIWRACSQEQDQLCFNNKADTIVSIHIEICLLLITFGALLRLSVYYAYAGLTSVYNVSYKLWCVIIKFNSILCYVPSQQLQGQLQKRRNIDNISTA
jgi:hypothetical protein